MTTTISLTEQIKREGGDRIASLVEDYETQLNMLAYLLSLLLAERGGATITPEQEQHIAISMSIQGWIADVQTKAAELVAAQDSTYADDAHWPAIPAGAEALIANF